MSARKASLIRPYLELVRLPAVFTAPADVLCGAVLVAGGTPAPIIDKLHRAVMDATHDPAVAPKLKALGVTLTDYSVQQTRKIMADDVAKWAKVAADTGYKPE